MVDTQPQVSAALLASADVRTGVKHNLPKYLAMESTATFERDIPTGPGCEPGRPMCYVFTRRGLASGGLGLEKRLEGSRRTLLLLLVPEDQRNSRLRW